MVQRWCTCGIVINIDISAVVNLSFGLFRIITPVGLLGERGNGRSFEIQNPLQRLIACVVLHHFLCAVEGGTMKQDRLNTLSLALP